MKPYNLLFFLAALLMISSCSSERAPTYHAKAGKRYHAQYSKCKTKDASRKHAYYNSLQYK